jgi:hypothetical protein
VNRPPSISEEDLAMTRTALATIGLILVGALASGCATTPMAAEPSASPDTSFRLRTANVDYLTAAAAAPMGLPPGARPGECYVQAVVPAQYENVTEQVLTKAASARAEVAPAEFRDVEEQVLVRSATKRMEAVPPVFEEVEEQVLVRPATTRLEPVPATYRTETSRILVRPAYTVWKRTSELTAAERAQQTIDPGAGDILCLVEVPAEYRTVTTEVLATPATTREVQVPAEYMTVKKTVVKTPATVREIEVPAEYRTVMVRKMVSPARETMVEIPAEYETVTRQVLKSAATTEWREVLCDNNATPALLGALQQSLRREGFDPGRDDGRVDAQTMGAVRAFQQARGLPTDGERYINMATVKALGVTP